MFFSFFSWCFFSFFHDVFLIFFYFSLIFSWFFYSFFMMFFHFFSWSFFSFFHNVFSITYLYSQNFKKIYKIILWKRIYPKKTEYLDYIRPFFSTFTSSLPLHFMRFSFLLCLAFITEIFTIFFIVSIIQLFQSNLCFFRLFKLHSFCSQTSER